MITSSKILLAASMTLFLISFPIMAIKLDDEGCHFSHSRATSSRPIVRPVPTPTPTPTPTLSPVETPPSASHPTIFASAAIGTNDARSVQSNQTVACPAHSTTASIQTEVAAPETAEQIRQRVVTWREGVRLNEVIYPDGGWNSRLHSSMRPWLSARARIRTILPSDSHMLNWCVATPVGDCPLRSYINALTGWEQQWLEGRIKENPSFIPSIRPLEDLELLEGIIPGIREIYAADALAIQQVPPIPSPSRAAASVVCASVSSFSASHSSSSAEAAGTRAIPLAITASSAGSVSLHSSLPMSPTLEVTGGVNSMTATSPIVAPSTTAAPASITTVSGTGAGGVQASSPSLASSSQQRQRVNVPNDLASSSVNVHRGTRTPASSLQERIRLFTAFQSGH